MIEAAHEFLSVQDTAILGFILNKQKMMESCWEAVDVKGEIGMHQIWCANGAGAGR